MKSTILMAALLSLSGMSLLHAQPVIRTNGVVNAASHISPGLPNYGVAQGSLFIVKGQGLYSRAAQPATGASASRTTLAGASMQITLGDSKIDVPMVSAGIANIGEDQ